MKSVRTAPTETGFFETYAKLAATINRSGTLSQVVSGLTEVGGIYAAAYSALLPIAPSIAIYAAAVVAILGTVVIEGGLKVLTPHTVDAILYRRYDGLHLPMTVAVWLLTAVLLTASALLSFHNSKAIVANVTPPAENLTTHRADSTLAAAKVINHASFAVDSAAISGQYTAQRQAMEASGQALVSSHRRTLEGWADRGRREGQSFASQEARARQAIADAQAEAALGLAALEAAKAKAMDDARTRRHDADALAVTAHTAATSDVRGANQTSEARREGMVKAYGGGLAWFTVACLFVFCTAVTLSRIHAKGSGITEKIELSQYDLNPAVWIEAWAALRERLQYEVRSRIVAFAERTPPAPLPTATTELYDPSQLAASIATLRIEKAAQEEDVLHIPNKRRIGYRRQGEDDASTGDTTSTGDTGHATGDTGKSCAIKDTRPPHTTLELRQLKQRLKDYKKRLGSHQQKAIAQARKDNTTSPRTLEAIENNRHWVEHYTKLIQEAEARTRH